MNKKKSKKFLEKCVEKVKENRDVQEVKNKLDTIKRRISA